MKIFLPFKKELNPYLEEIIEHSAHKFYYGNYLNFIPEYDIVNIHWPEALFEWKEPSPAELKELEYCICEWKKNAVLVYTKHDYLRNKGTTSNFTRLFELIEKNTDVFIHLGKHSNSVYQKIYPLARHEIIHHPLYNDSFSQKDKKEARKLLDIAKDDFVMIVPGTVRNYAERDLIFEAFKSLQAKSKVLICINMHSELRFDFPGRVKLKKIIDVKKLLTERFKEKHKPPKFLFTYGTQSNFDLALKLSSADLVFIPRLETLNSGILFLGLTFNKIVVGPSIGNIEEHLEDLGLPIFNPEQKNSISAAINKGMELSRGHKLYTNEMMKKYLPETVARQMDNLINDFK